MKNKSISILVFLVILLSSCSKNNNLDFIEEYCGDITVTPTEPIDDYLPSTDSFTIVRHSKLFTPDRIKEEKEIPYTLVRTWTGPDFCIEGQ